MYEQSDLEKKHKFPHRLAYLIEPELFKGGFISKSLDDLSSMIHQRYKFWLRFEFFLWGANLLDRKRTGIELLNVYEMKQSSGLIPLTSRRYTKICASRSSWKPTF